MVRNAKTLKIRGGPAGARITELTLDGVDILKNAFSVAIKADVDSAIEATVGYRIIDTDLELDVGRAQHVVMLQRRQWVKNPMTGETDSVLLYETQAVDDDGLPAALRKLADTLDAE